jgi:hypothetical protein
MTRKTASLCLQVTQDTERYVNKLRLRIRQLPSLNSSHHTVCPGWGFPSIRHSFQANVTRVPPFRYHNPPPPNAQTLILLQFLLTLCMIPYAADRRLVLKVWRVSREQRSISPLHHIWRAFSGIPWTQRYESEWRYGVVFFSKNRVLSER